MDIRPGYPGRFPGNHDKALREYDDTSFGDIRVCKEPQRPR